MTVLSSWPDTSSRKIRLTSRPARTHKPGSYVARQLLLQEQADVGCGNRETCTFLIMITILPCNSDQLYWEKQERQEHDQKPSSSGKATSGKGSDNRQMGQPTTSSSNTQSRSQQSNQPNRQNTNKTPNRSNTTSNKTSSSNTGSSSSNTSPKSYVNLLGSDGKLKPEEKERRKRLGLCLVCLVCGGNHTTDKCPNHRSAQGRSAQAKTFGNSRGKNLGELGV